MTRGFECGQCGRRLGADEGSWFTRHEVVEFSTGNVADPRFYRRSQRVRLCRTCLPEDRASQAAAALRLALGAALGGLLLFLFLNVVFFDVIF